MTKEEKIELFIKEIDILNQKFNGNIILSFEVRTHLINKLGISERTIYYWLHKYKPEVIDSTERLSNRAKEVVRRTEYLLSSIDRFKDDIRVNHSNPIGLILYGDMHIDSEGTDIDRLKHDLAYLKHPNIFGGNLGDTLNNWKGYLAYLYGHQSATVADGWEFVEKEIAPYKDKFMFNIIGNHDSWNNGAYILKEKFKNSVVATRAIFKIYFSNGTKVRINASHKLRGSSQYNPAHGAIKEALLNNREDIVCHGHTHSTGYSILKDTVTGRVMHGLVVAGYKVIDDFAYTEAFRDNHISSSVMLVIDPRLSEIHPDRIKIFFDLKTGKEYLDLISGKNK